MAYFQLFKEKSIFYRVTQIEFWKNLYHQDVPGCLDIETTASQRPKLHENYSHWWWKRVGFFKTIFEWKYFFYIFEYKNPQNPFHSSWIIGKILVGIYNVYLHTFASFCQTRPRLSAPSRTVRPLSAALLTKKTSMAQNA